MDGSTFYILKFLPLLLLTAALFAWFGWWLHTRSHKCPATAAELSVERAKTKEAEDRARAADQACKSAQGELSALKGKKVAKDTTELDALQKTLDDERARAAGLTSQLQKAREASIASESKVTDAGKAAQAKVFELQNELAKAREEAVRDRHAAEKAKDEVESMKATLPSKSEETAALEKEVINLRRNFTQADNASADAKRERDNAEAELAMVKSKLTALETELSRSKAAGQATARTTTSAPPRYDMPTVASLAPARRAPRPDPAPERFVAREEAAPLSAAFGGPSEDNDAAATEAAAKAKAAAEAAEAEAAAKAKAAADAAEAEAAAKAKAAADAAEAETAAKAKAAADAAESEAAAKAKVVADAAEAEATAKAKAAADAAEAETAAKAKAAADAAEAEAAAAAKAAADAEASASATPAEEAPTADTAAAPKVKNAEATDALGKRVVQDDLKIIEGIGPKIEELLHAASILTWQQLADTTSESIKTILNNAGERFTMHDPTTWPNQSSLAAAGRWTELRELQDKLDGGKIVA